MIVWLVWLCVVFIWCIIVAGWRWCCFVYWFQLLVWVVFRLWSICGYGVFDVATPAVFCYFYCGSVFVLFGGLSVGLFLVGFFGVVILIVWVSCL